VPSSQPSSNSVTHRRHDIDSPKSLYTNRNRLNLNTTQLYRQTMCASFVTPYGVLFSIDFFVSLYLCLFVCFFVSKITRKRLDDLHETFREGAE